MKIKVIIYKDMARASYSLHVIKSEGSKKFTLTSDQGYIEMQDHCYYPCLLELPLDFELITEGYVQESKQLLVQKDLDKNDHIKSLETIISRMMAMSIK